MKFSDITPKNLGHIEKCIETILKRIGVNTSITLSARTIRSEEYIYAESADIAMSPMMFQRVRVKGEGGILHDEEHPKCYDLNIHLDYRYDLFSGGSSGTEIGQVMIRIIQDGDYQSVRLKGMLLTASAEEEEE